MTATISPAFQRILRNSDLSSMSIAQRNLLLQQHYRTPDTQDNSTNNIFLQTDYVTHTDTCPPTKLNHYMDNFDDDELIEIKQEGGEQFEMQRSSVGGISAGDNLQ